MSIFQVYMIVALIFGAINGMGVTAHFVLHQRRYYIPTGENVKDSFTRGIILIVHWSVSSILSAVAMPNFVLELVVPTKIKAWFWKSLGNLWSGVLERRNNRKRGIK